MILFGLNRPVLDTVRVCVCVCVRYVVLIKVVIITLAQHGGTAPHSRNQFTVPTMNSVTIADDGHTAAETRV